MKVFIVEEDLKKKLNPDYVKKDTKIEFTMQYRDFAKWVKSSEVLREFDLSDILLKELFTILDPHKKGHLTRLDW